MSSTKLHNMNSGHRPSLIEGIKSCVRDRVGSQLRDLEVAVRGGGLVLQGETRTHYAKQLVLQAVMDNSELPILSNEIQVRRDEGGAGRPGVLKSPRRERPVECSGSPPGGDSVSLSIGPEGPAYRVDTMVSA